jgi:DNA topoisomerase I
MAYELIITEKPNAAKMIAEALAEGKPIKENNQGVPYYKITHKNKDIVVGCAVGHLYTVAEKDKSFNYPVFDLQWKATSDIDTKSFTKKYVATLKKIAKDAKEFTVATDYDIEGEVIGLNCVRYICKQKDAARMKFSTLTKHDLIEAYEKKSSTLDWGQAYAGETRHYLDWMYGINVSRALTHAIKSSGMFKIMSSGRVQGPALKLVVEKEKEIKAFKPVKYWQIQLNGKIASHEQLIEFWHNKEKILDEKEAVSILNKVKGKNGKISKVDRSEYAQKSPTPFDLTTLQTESYRFFGISPKHTLDIAQELYSSGFISYPRTSSQKLPKEINYKRILDSLAKNRAYTELAKQISQGPMIPHEGKKTDPAHPAIYPTGIMPKLTGREEKVYDIIVKRFFACFAPDAKRETITLTADVETELFIAKGTRTIESGWHKFYSPYLNLDEQQLPKVKSNDILNNNEVIKHDKETQPPKRFTPASIIRELEKQNLGTKATRATILDSLYQRNYIKNESIEATDLGIQTVATLEKYSPEIQDVKLTRHFENEMEKIRARKTSGDKVLKEAENTLTKILEKFRKNEKLIGKELQSSNRESMEKESLLGKCPKCGKGNLKIMYSRKTKRKFIACDSYPDCKTIMNMPSYSVKPTTKQCEKCSYPIAVVGTGKSTRETCLNMECPTKQSADKKVNKEIAALESGKIEKDCPKCDKKLVLRRSVYGQFLGCSGYPNCRYIENIAKTPEEQKKIDEKRAFFEKQRSMGTIEKTETKSQRKGPKPKKEDSMPQKEESKFGSKNNKEDTVQEKKGPQKNAKDKKQKKSVKSK